MRVTKRDGTQETVQFDKITERLDRLCAQLPALSAPDVTRVAGKVCSQIVDGITTEKLDELTADVAYSLGTEHPEYATLASRILISNLQKNTSSDLVDTYQKMSGVLAPWFMDFVASRRKDLESLVEYSRDFDFDYFGVRTMLRMYLTRVDNRVVERPQHMFLRVAIGIWGQSDAPDAWERLCATYDGLSRKLFTHASPTLFNAGLKFPQLSSCFLATIEPDSIDGIFETVGDCARISKFGGGIGLSASGIRAKGSVIRGTNGHSDGLVPMLRVFNSVAQYVNQGGRRKGSIAVYLEPHHADIMDFLDLRRNTGDDNLRARDLFLGMWIPDIFMRRVEAQGTWSLMDPAQCPGLNELWGKDYDDAYEAYEAAGKFVRQLPAQDLWFAMLRSQIETGLPYLLFKDAANAKSNQQHLGAIKSSNLCTEIIEFTSPDEIAVCNLASISLPAFVRDKSFDFLGLLQTAKCVAANLDRVIDVTFYPVDKARRSNLRHRPIGIGVQGLADVFHALKMAFDSPEAADLNRKIAETIYFGAAEASMELAKAFGAYETFKGSPASQGKLQPDLWNVTPCMPYAWDTLRRDIVDYGMRNSLLVAPMPTASTAQLLGNTECFEPITSNLYSRRTLAGEFAVVNSHLVRDLLDLNLWTPEIKNKIIVADGSVQSIQEIPADIRARYKTAWELSMKTLIDLAADRASFVCQSQSLNLFVGEPNFRKLSSMHFYAWKRGLKTGCYYLRTKPATRAVQVTVDPCVSCSA